MPISTNKSADTETDNALDSTGNTVDSGQTVLELRTAARFLRTTPEALRKRIARGTVDARKENGRWLVVVDTADRPSGKKRTGVPDTSDLYERLLKATEEATRYKVLCEVSESTRHETEEHYQAEIAELQARVKELDRRHWWQRGK